MNNIYCTRLKFNFDLNLDFFKHIEKNQTDFSQHYVYQLPKEFHDQTLVNLLQNYNISIYHADLFMTPPHGEIPAHIDALSLCSMAKLNWVFGSDNSTMSWYTLKDSEKSIIPQNRIGGPKYSFTDIDTSNQLWVDKIDQSCLIDAGIPHKVNNYSDIPRWCISYALWDIEKDNLLTWKDAVDRLHEYII